VDSKADVTPERAERLREVLNELSEGHLRGFDSRRLADEGREALAVLEEQLKTERKCAIDAETRIIHARQKGFDV